MLLIEVKKNKITKEQDFSHTAQVIFSLVLYDICIYNQQQPDFFGRS